MAKQTDASSMNRRQQFAETYRITKRTYPRIGLVLLGTFLLAGAIGFTLFKILPGSGAIEWVLSVVGGIMFGTLGALIPPSIAFVIYGWFTEGFGTPDLVDAKVLIEELA